MSYTMKQRLELLKQHGVTVEYAVPQDAYRDGFLRTYDVTTYPQCSADRPFAIVPHASDHWDADFIDRSNHRVLHATYGAAMVDVQWSTGFFVHSASDGLIDAVAGLQDYCLLDDSDLSELESNAIGEAWSEYLQWDLFRDLPEWFNELSDRYDNDTLRDAFYQGLHDADYYPECAGSEVRWDYDKCGDILITVIRNLRRAELGRPAL